jgi:serine protease inhibitor
MKKDYQAPKAEKMEFNYSEVVVASNICKWVEERTDTGYTGCVENKTGKEYATDILD